MDVVICVATRDCLILKKNIKYIRKNIIASDNIYIITKVANKHLFSSYFLNKYGVILIDENNLCEGLSFDSIKKMFVSRGYLSLRVGWYFQQFLKMGFALSEYAKQEYLIWDADTIPLRQLSFEKEGKKFFTLKEEYHRPYFETIGKMLGINKCVEGSFIAEHMLIETNLMKSLIDALSSKNKNWLDTILDSINPNEPASFSEFETYGTYVQTNFPDKYSFQVLKTQREAGFLYGRCVTDKELKFLAKEYDTASFEAYHLPPKPRYYFCKLQSKFLEYYSLIFK